MSITITSTHKKSKGEHTIRLTRELVNTCSNILKLDGTTTDCYISNIRIKHLTTYKQFMIDSHIFKSYKKLLELFGVDYNLVTSMDLNKIEGYVYNRDGNKNLMITSDIIEKIDYVVPLGINNVCIYNCHSLIELSISGAQEIVNVGYNDSLVKANIITKNTAIVEHNDSLNELVVYSKYSSSIGYNKLMIHRLSIRRIDDEYTKYIYTTTKQQMYNLLDN